MLGSELLKFFGTAGSGGGGAGNLVVMNDYVSGVTRAEWALGYDGYEYERGDEGASARDDPWLNPQTGMNLYEVQVTATGDSPYGTLGSYIPLGTITQIWGLSTEYAPKSCTLTVTIRLASNHSITKTVTVNLNAYGLA